MNGERRIVILICVVLAAITSGAFRRVLGCGFVDYDDDRYVTANHWVQSGLTTGSVKWALTAGYEATWQPMVWLSYMADHGVYGLNPTGYHLTNLHLHLLNVLLLFLVLMRMTGSVWRSAFVAALFAVHPLRVESVAWVAERKDVLSGLFWMLSMGAYVLYCERPGWKRYGAVFLLMALGLMAKPTLVTLPIVFLLLDYWPLRRISGKTTFRRLVLEKIPLLCLSAASTVISVIVQTKSGGLEAIERLPMGVRLANAAYSYVAYLVKMIWPAKLAVFYPHPYGTLPMWEVVGSVVLLVCVTAIVLRSANTRPYLAVGWLWYLVTMLPMIGIIQTGMHGMADRFTYIPLIGVSLALTWGIAECESMGVWAYGRRRSGSPTPPYSHTPTLPYSHTPILPYPHTPILPYPHTPILWLPAALIILACAAGTWHQTGYWKDSVALFSRAVEVTQNNHVMETNLGLALNKQGNYDDAIPHFRASIRIDPTEKACNGIGVALASTNRQAEAVLYYERSLDLEPTSAETRSNLGFALLDLGETDRAIAQFTESVRLKSEEVGPHFGLGLAYSQRGKVRDAEREFHRVLSIDPNSVPANNELARLAFEQGKIDEAIGYLEAVTRVSPDAEAHYRLGSILARRKRYDEAIEHFRSAIRIEPGHVLAHYDLGMAYSMKGRMDEAIEQYSEAARIAPDYAQAHVSLAIALYSKGDYAGSWREVGLARSLGVKPDPQFLKELSARMPPGR